MEQVQDGSRLEDFTILFVCTGNTCRSPMAEGLAREAFASHGIRVRVESAGTAAEGHVAENAVAAMKRRGIDITGHVPRQLATELIERADLVLTMEPHHCRSVLARVAARPRPRVFTIAEFADKAERKPPAPRQGIGEWLASIAALDPCDGPEIDDPVNGDAARYETTALQLEILTSQLAASFAKLSQ